MTNNQQTANIEKPLIQKKPDAILQDVVKEIGSNKLIDDLIITNDIRCQYDKPSNYWSFHNQFLMVRQGTTDARGKNQWLEWKPKGSSKTQLIDRKLNPDVIQKPVYIYGVRYVWMCLKCEVQMIDSKLETRCNNCKQSRQNNPKNFKSVFDGFTVIPLIRVEDTIGKPLPETKPKKRPNLLDVAKKMGLTVRYSEMSGLNGYYHTVNKEIVLATSDQTVFFHELAHAIDHKLNADFNKQSKAKCEAVAELTACVIARMYGIECIGQSQKYLKMYTKGKDAKWVSNLCMGVLNKVGAILDYIFNEKTKKGSKLK